MFALIGYLLCRILKPALSVVRRPPEAPAWSMAALRGAAGREEFSWRRSWLFSKRLANYFSALMALSVKSPVAGRCRIVAAKMRAAGRAEGALALGTPGQWNWSGRFGCRFAVLRHHAFLLLCAGLLFRSRRILFRDRRLLFRGSGFHFGDAGL